MPTASSYCFSFTCDECCSKLLSNSELDAFLLPSYCSVTVARDAGGLRYVSKVLMEALCEMEKVFRSKITEFIFSNPSVTGNERYCGDTRYCVPPGGHQRYLVHHS